MRVGSTTVRSNTIEVKFPKKTILNTSFLNKEGNRNDAGKGEGKDNRYTQQQL